MTRKHFEAIALSISETKNWFSRQGYSAETAIGGHTSLLYLEKVLAEYFASVNPNFNREKFAEACAAAAPCTKKISN